MTRKTRRASPDGAECADGAACPGCAALRAQLESVLAQWDARVDAAREDARLAAQDGRPAGRRRPTTPERSE